MTIKITSRESKITVTRIDATCDMCGFVLENARLAHDHPEDGGEYICYRCQNEINAEKTKEHFRWLIDSRIKSLIVENDWITRLILETKDGTERLMTIEYSEENEEEDLSDDRND